MPSDVAVKPAGTTRLIKKLVLGGISVGILANRLPLLLRNGRAKHLVKLAKLAAVALTLPVGYCLAYVVRTWLQKLHLPPGPWPYPIVGNFPHLVSKHGAPHRSLQYLHKQYGPLLTMWYGSKLTIVIGDPQLIQQTHRDQSEKFQHRTLVDFAKQSLKAEPDLDLPPCCNAFSGKNVALSGGKYWVKARKVFVQELMSKRFIEDECVPKIIEEIWSAVKGVHDLGGKHFDPHEHLQRLSCNIVYRLTYGIRFKTSDVGIHDSDWGKLHTIINSILQLGGQNVKANYIPILKFLSKFSESGRKLQQLRDDTIASRDAILARLLEEHKRTLDRSNPRDFLDVLILRQSKDGLTDQEITFIAWEFITAGTDTTSATIHWLLLLLANHPEFQRKAQAEIDSVCKGRPVSMDDIDNLPYTNACLLECMRYFPAVPLMVPYMASQDATVKLDGKEYLIKQGTQVIMNGFNMHRDPALWKNPDEFDPGRFMEGPDADIQLKGADAPNDPHHLKFMPLGTGRRACAGALLAKLELCVQAATLLQAFFWAPAVGDKVQLTERFGIALSAGHVDLTAKWRPENGIDLDKTIEAVGAGL